MKSEFELVLQYRNAKEKREKIDDEFSKAKAEEEATKLEVIEYMNEANITKTAMFDGVGSISITKPQLFANVKKEDEADLFLFLTDKGRSDLIKETVNSKSLSSFVGELIDKGQTIPQFISYYLKPGVRLNQ